MKKILIAFSIFLAACTANKQSTPKESLLDSCIVSNQPTPEDSLLKSDFSPEAIEHYINAVDTPDYELINKHVPGKAFYCYFGYFSEEYCNSKIKHGKFLTLEYDGEYMQGIVDTLIFINYKVGDDTEVYYGKFDDSFVTYVMSDGRWLYCNQWEGKSDKLRKY